MLRIGRLTDYGILTLTFLARDPEQGTHNARDVSAKLQLPLPTVSKLLKLLARQGLLATHRGARGGFSLARPAREITLLEVIDAIEGPVSLTVCNERAPHDCQIEQHCMCRENWMKINQAVRGALAQISLTDMTQPLPQVHQLTRIGSQNWSV